MRRFSLRRCATRILERVMRSARAGAASLPRSALASTGTGANCEAGPSGFGDSTALDRSRPRNWSGRYSSATDRPLHAESVVQRIAMKRFFRTIRGLLKHSKNGTTAYLGSEKRTSNCICQQGYRAPMSPDPGAAGGRTLKQISEISFLDILT